MDLYSYLKSPLNLLYERGEGQFYRRRTITIFLRRRQCHEETKQAQGAKALAQVEVQQGAAVAAVEGAAVAVALVGTAFARAVVKGSPTNWVNLALSNGVPSAALP